MAGTITEKGSTSETGISMIEVSISAVEPGIPAAEEGGLARKDGLPGQGMGGNKP